MQDFTLHRRAPNSAFAYESVGLFYIADNAGMGDRRAEWLIPYVETLINDHGFPTPIIGENGAAVNLLSRWHRVEVDHWFASPPPPLLALASHNPNAVRSRSLGAPALAGPGAAA